MSYLLGRLFGNLTQRLTLVQPSSFSLFSRSASTNTKKSNSTSPGPYPQYKNLPPHPVFSGKGNAFETSVVRKRVIADPNVPSFDSIGELKWCGWRMLRDCRRRHLFTRYYPAQAVYFNLRKNRSLPNSIREVATEKEFSLPRDSMIGMMHQRCAITGRSRGLLKRYRLSRLAWRHQADYNQLSGVIKACWG